MNKKISLRSLLVIIIVLAISVFYQLPYYVSKPGMAKELNEIVSVEDGYDYSGSFMLTTVKMGRANIYSYAYSMFAKYNKILPLKAVQDENETDEEYMMRQLHYMNSSKLSAIEVAYKQANIDIDYKYNGVYVLAIVDKMPANKKLQPGDRIFEVDGQQFETRQQFVDYVGSKNAGEKIKVTFERDNKNITEIITVEKYESDINKTGIGIVLVEDREIITKPDVIVETEDIGGPSAGLMFSLEIYNQLTEEDYTKGYEIAGTGTIDADGNVGRIGGIDQKVVAAHKTGADIFFAPFENGKDGSNFDEAVSTAKALGTKMKIIPVDTFNDAIKYLKSLK